VRASTRGRFAPGSANGGTAEHRWRCARAKDRPGMGIYIRWRSVRGPGVDHVAGARAAWAARRDDVRRTNGPMVSGGWDAGEWDTATWHRPSAHGHHAQQIFGAAHGPMGPPVPRHARATRVWRVDVASRGTTSCVRAPVLKTVSFSTFPIKFSPKI
jgi:hypothetical protein